MREAARKNFAIFKGKNADLQLYSKQTPTQVFPWEYCETFKNKYFEEHLLTAAFDFLRQLQNSGEQLLLY